ncbi:MAG TPA: aspartyl protease family protein, partial [Candidatus Saccharimonadales bacterium]|nr:aspartyl protease family protein [Candidatus Saccharimonadales bacterium]
GEMAVGRNRADEGRDLLRKAARDERVARSAWAELARLSLHVGDARAALAAAERAAASPAAGDVTGEESIGATVAYLRMLGPEPLLGMRPGFDGTIVRFLEREGWRDRGAREVPVEINGAGSWPVDIDSAYRGNLILSERLASDLGIRRAGEFGAAGVGATAPVLEGSLLDEIRIGSLVLRRVPVMVMDSPSFRGEAKGLLGTGLLKRFDCVLDERAGTFEIRPPGRPDDAGGRIAARAPLFVEGGPIVNAGLAGGPRRPFLLDTAASVTLLDRGYYERHVKPALPAGAAREAVVAGAGGRETAILIPDLQAVIGNSGIGRLRVVVLDMSRINRAGGRLASGIVGGELLRRYRVHLRFSVPEILLEEYREEPGV